MSATRALRAPSKVASALDWKKASGAILALDVGAEKIGLAVASHPAYGEAPLPLEPVSIELETRNNKRVLSSSIKDQLEQLVKTHNVSSFVVSWPVQKEGRCGAACGKVLHTLDSLVEDSNVMTSKRPFCLWDEHHYQAREDEWGRNPLYGEPCNDNSKTVYKASEEQYTHDSSSAVAANVMNDFMKSQWPEIYLQQSQEEQSASPADTRTTTTTPDVSIEWLEHYEDTEAYMTVAV